MCSTFRLEAWQEQGSLFRDIGLLLPETIPGIASVSVLRLVSLLVSFFCLEITWPDTKLVNL